ncbi:MAG: hypothetical protein JXB88_12255 [Spirochaetales bacterium]|nr:hypothetical protein [Spirochaetales bacterium]
MPARRRWAGRSLIPSTGNLPGTGTVEIHDSGTTATFSYDARGNRVTKSVNGITTYYFFGNYEEAVAGGETKVVKYYFGPNGRIAQRTKAGTEEEIIYLHTDHLGSAVRMTDMAGNPVQSIVYDPFGKTVYSAGSGSPAYQFTDQLFDAEIGLYYYEARYYDPEMGRFIQADTVLDGLNRYAYCRNSPVMYIDPTGCTTNAKDYHDSSWGYHMNYGDTITCSYTGDDGNYYTDTTIVGNSYGDGMYGPGGFETETRREFSFKPDIPDVSSLNRPQDPENNGELPPLPGQELPAPKFVPDVTGIITNSMFIAVADHFPVIEHIIITLYLFCNKYIIKKHKKRQEKSYMTLDIRPDRD